MADGSKAIESRAIESRAIESRAIESRAIESRAIDDKLRLFEAMEDAWFAKGANLDYTLFVDNAETETKNDYAAILQTVSKTILNQVERNWFLTYNPRTAAYATR